MITSSIYSTVYKSHFTFKIFFKGKSNYDRSTFQSCPRYDLFFFSSSIVSIIIESIRTIKIKFFPDQMSPYAIFLNEFFSKFSSLTSMWRFCNDNFRKHFWYLNLSECAIHFLTRLEFLQNCQKILKKYF